MEAVDTRGEAVDARVEAGPTGTAEEAEEAATSCLGGETTAGNEDVEGAVKFCSEIWLAADKPGEGGAEADTRTVLRDMTGEAGADLPLFCPDFSVP